MCTVVDTQGSSRNVSRSIQVQVLDEDDNPPEAQENNLQIHLDNDKVSEVGVLFGRLIYGASG